MVRITLVRTAASFQSSGVNGFLRRHNPELCRVDHRDWAAMPGGSTDTQSAPIALKSQGVHGIGPNELDLRRRPNGVNHGRAACCREPTREWGNIRSYTATTADELGLCEQPADPNNRPGAAAAHAVDDRRLPRTDSSWSVSDQTRTAALFLALSSGCFQTGRYEPRELQERAGGGTKARPNPLGAPPVEGCVGWSRRSC